MQLLVICRFRHCEHGRALLHFRFAEWHGKHARLTRFLVLGCDSSGDWVLVVSCLVEFMLSDAAETLSSI
jgi:hypothetical protein